MAHSALIVLAEGFEELEAVTPIDLLRRANIAVTIAGLTTINVRGARGITVTADSLFADCSANSFDALILPGGMPGAKNLAASIELRAIIQSFDAAGKLLAAICAAPIVLAAAGVLKGHRVTSFPGYEDTLGCKEYVTDAVVRDGTVITSRGAGTSIQFALEIISYLAGAEAANAVAKAILFATK